MEQTVCQHRSRRITLRAVALTEVTYLRMHTSQMPKATKTTPKTTETVNGSLRSKIEKITPNTGAAKLNTEI